MSRSGSRSNAFGASKGSHGGSAAISGPSTALRHASKSAVSTGRPSPQSTASAEEARGKAVIQFYEDETRGREDIAHLYSHEAKQLLLHKRRLDLQYKDERIQALEKQLERIEGTPSRTTEVWDSIERTLLQQLCVYENVGEEAFRGKNIPYLLNQLKQYWAFYTREREELISHVSKLNATVSELTERCRHRDEEITSLRAALSQKLHLTNEEEKKLKGRCRNQEAQVSQRMKGVIDDLVKSVEGIVGKIDSVDPIVTITDIADTRKKITTKYIDLLDNINMELRNMSSELLEQSKTMHSNLPTRIVLQLSECGAEELVKIIKVLSFEKGVTDYLYEYFPRQDAPIPLKPPSTPPLPPSPPHSPPSQPPRHLLRLSPRSPRYDVATVQDSGEPSFATIDMAPVSVRLVEPKVDRGIQRVIAAEQSGGKAAWSAVGVATVSDTATHKSHLPPIH